MITWACGITTVSTRKNSTFPIAFKSIREAGFEPWVFADDATNSEYMDLPVPVTNRSPRLGAFGNWIMALIELYIRKPTAKRFIIFQDDAIVCKGLRDYLERSRLPEKGYYNLYSFPENEALANGKQGWHASNQKGRGAVALMFTKEAVLKIFQSEHVQYKPQHVMNSLRGIDSCLMHTFTSIGWKEYVHYPSLAQHMGIESSIGSIRHPQSQSFPGRDFNAMELLK